MCDGNNKQILLERIGAGSPCVMIEPRGVKLPEGVLTI